MSEENKKNGDWTKTVTVVLIALLLLTLASFLSKLLIPVVLIGLIVYGSYKLVKWTNSSDDSSESSN